MASITASGLGSGLDINGLVSQLVAAEGQPVAQRLGLKEAGYQAKLSAVGTLKGALSDLQSKLSALKATTTFEKRTASSDHKDLLTATATASAARGQYAIEVTRLAQAHKLAFPSLPAGETLGGSAGDSVTVTVGTTSFTVDLSSGMTVGQLRDAINGATENADPLLTAAVVSTDGGGEGLVLTSAATGYENRIQLVFGGTLNGEELGTSTVNRGADGALVTDLTQLDASLIVEGYAVTRSGNTIDDVIEGVTLKLNGAEAGTHVTLGVALDRSAVTGAAQQLVTSYNSLLQIMQSQTHFDAETGDAGVLLGDATLRTLGSALRREMGAVVGDAKASLRMLTDVGITSATDGTLSLDTGRLDAALAADPNAVTRLFAGEGGVAVRLDGLLQSYLQTGGIMDTRSSGLQASIADINDQREALETRMAALEARYRSQFTALDALVGQLSATSTYLSQQLAALPGAYNPDRT